MKIILYSYDASEEDCRRNDFCTRVDGREYMLAVSALGTYWNWLEIQDAARKYFGDDVEIVFGPDCAGCSTTEPRCLKP